MSVIGSNILAGASGQGGGYNLTKSLRFRSSASAYLNRTPATAGNRRTFTFSAWVKRGLLSNADQYIFTSSEIQDDKIRFNTDNTLTFQVSLFGLTTTAVFRDPSAWYHVVFTLDTTQATASNRMNIYINGVQQTSFSSDTRSSITQNLQTDFNNTVLHHIAKYYSGAGLYFDGYMAEVNFIDGQALTPSSFGETSTTTGVWIPKKYSGSYGTNGFYLKFTDTTSTSTLGTDFSGNSNTWTVNNISLTTGSTYDSMTDVPTLTSATTANYCVVNPLSKTSFAIIKGANLNVESVNDSASIAIVGGTFGVTSGKWYWEVTATAVDSNRMAMYVCDATKNGQNLTASTGAYGYGASGNKIQGDGTNWYGTSSSYGNSWTTNDIIGIALDLDNGKVWFSKNGTWQASGDPAAGTNAAFTSVSGSKTCGMFLYTEASTTSAAFNLGQQPFSYTPPTGFVALNTFNLPTPTIGATASTPANKYMDATTYTGNGTVLGSTQTITNAGSFQPDLVWLKSRSNAQDNNLYDAVRGISGTGSPALFSNLTDAETTYTGYGVSALNSNGFTLIGNGGLSNNNGFTYVGWQWRASNATAVTNTAGTITSTVSANTTAGFSVVTYTGTGSNATVGHGLGVAPSMVIVKRRDAGGSGWSVYFITLPAGYVLSLQSTNAQANSSGRFTTTLPTSSVFSVGTDSDLNGSGGTYVAYCFAPVAGYSAMGSYTGNGSTDGTFVHLGFRPRFLLTRRSDGIESWRIGDSSRSPYNGVELELFANLSNAEEDNDNPIDYLSNGFKIRTSSSSHNASGGTYIYMAFAEVPYKYSLGR